MDIFTITTTSTRLHSTGTIKPYLTIRVRSITLPYLLFNVIRISHCIYIYITVTFLVSPHKKKQSIKFRELEKCVHHQLQRESQANCFLHKYQILGFVNHKMIHYIIITLFDCQFIELMSSQSKCRSIMHCNTEGIYHSVWMIFDIIECYSLFCTFHDGSSVYSCGTYLLGFHWVCSVSLSIPLTADLLSCWLVWSKEINLASTQIKPWTEWMSMPIEPLPNFPPFSCLIRLHQMEHFWWLWQTWNV